jgi:hypothetical protein
MQELECLEVWKGTGRNFAEIGVFMQNDFSNGGPRPSLPIHGGLRLNEKGKIRI